MIPFRESDIYEIGELPVVIRTGIFLVVPIFFHHLFCVDDT
jgi:hypothetical protein